MWIFYVECNFLTDIGNKRVVFSDQNFPLEGTQSAIGRSIVILGPNYSTERYACANIEPDHDIVKYINLQKPPKFVVWVGILDSIDDYNKPNDKYFSLGLNFWRM